MTDRTLLLALGIALVIIFSAIKIELPNPPVAWVEPVVESAAGNVTGIGQTMAGMVREVTAYNVGDPKQTGKDPCIGAGGHDLCELVRKGVKVCAANFVPLQTILHIEGYGEYIVLDRMHRRFSHRIDIAMNEKEIGKARKFGVQKRVIKTEYLPEGLGTID